MQLEYMYCTCRVSRAITYFRRNVDNSKRNIFCILLIFSFWLFFAGLLKWSLKLVSCGANARFWVYVQQAITITSIEYAYMKTDVKTIRKVVGTSSSKDVDTIVFRQYDSQVFTRRRNTSKALIHHRNRSIGKSQAWACWECKWIGKLMPGCADSGLPWQLILIRSGSILASNPGPHHFDPSARPSWRGLFTKVEHSDRSDEGLGSRLDRSLRDSFSCSFFFGVHHTHKNSLLLLFLSLVNFDGTFFVSYFLRKTRFE